MPERTPHRHGRRAANADVDAVKQIIADAEKTAAENTRLASLGESYRRTIFLLVQAAGGEVAIDKTIAGLLNGQAGLARRFEVIANDPTRPDMLVYRNLPMATTSEVVLEGGVPTAKVGAEITWAQWQLECVLADGTRWAPTCAGVFKPEAVLAAMPEGTRLVQLRLRGMTGEPPVPGEVVELMPPPPDPEAQPSGLVLP